MKKENIKLPLIIALGTHKNCREIITEIYNSNETKYYEAYMKSELYNNVIKEIFTIMDIESINKLIGIYEICTQDDNYILIEKIIKSVNPSIIKFVKTKPVVDVDVFFNKYYDIKTIPEHEMYVVAFCLLFVAIQYKKNFQGNVFYDVTRYWNTISTSIQYNIRLNKEYEIKNVEQSNLNRIYEIIGVKENDFPIVINSIFDNVIEKETLDIAKRDKVPLDSDDRFYNQEDYLRCRDKSFTEGLSKYIGIMSGLYSKLGLDSNSIFIREVDKCHFDAILNICLTFEKWNKLEEIEIIQFIITSLFTDTLVELYFEAKDLYLNKSKDDKYKYLVQYEKDLKIEKEKLEAEKKISQRNISDKNDEIKTLQESIRELEHSNKKLDNDLLKAENKIKDIEISENDKKERIELLNSIIDRFNVRVDNQLSLDEMIAYINRYKLALFGGHNTTKGKLQIGIKNILMYDKMTADISAVRNIDYVFINTDWFSHAFDKKVLSICTKYNKPFKYIGGTNYESVIRQIFIALKEIEDK